ncbi:hypothetical protein [Streptomyces sp. NPDC127112]|uniref:hypothetical protein n=1 Tax=Streptomyces sp. NPDC127112 TaxID=3345364 RepID=UPI00363B318D
MTAGASSRCRRSPRRPCPRRDGPRVRWRDLVAAEWIKLWSLRSTRSVLGLGVLIFLLLALQRSLGSYDEWPEYGPIQRSHYDSMTEALSGAGVALLMIGAGTVGALSLVGEYASGLIHATLTAEHREVARPVRLGRGSDESRGAVALRRGNRQCLRQWRHPRRRNGLIR